MGYDLHESEVPSIGLVWRAVTGGDYYIVIGDGKYRRRLRTHRNRGGGNGTNSHARSDHVTNSHTRSDRHHSRRPRVPSPPSAPGRATPAR